MKTLRNCFQLVRETVSNLFGKLFPDWLGNSFCVSGQATTELAIFGSLILICLAVLISYGQTMQEQQILQQQAFRKALKKAYDENAFVSYNIVKNPRVPNLFGGYGEESRSSTSAGASVAWCLGLPEQKSYYQINEDEFELPDGIKIEDVQSFASTGYASQDIRYEDPSVRVSQKQSILTETITTYLRADSGSEIIVTQGLDTDGRYRQSAVGTEIYRGRQWVTPQQ